MDLKVLFHNPESLNDDELRYIIATIEKQRATPRYWGIGAAAAMYLLDVKVLRRHRDWKRVIAAGTLATLAGWRRSETIHFVDDPRYDAQFQPDIVQAFDQRYINNVLNHTGFGSNYMGARDYTYGYHKKPY